jgi:hypothetical protein
VLAGAVTLALAAGTVTGAVAVPAAPAFASLPGLSQQYGNSLENSDPSKTAVATCPNGTNVVGMGGSLWSASGDVAIEAIVPDLGTRTVTVTAKEVDPFSGAWRATAWAMCATAPAGLVRVFAPSVSNSTDKSVTATCPLNTTLLAIGFDVGAGYGEVLVNQVRPDGGAGIAATSAIVSAFEDETYTTNWTISAYLLCANPIAGQQVMTAATPPSTTTPISAVVAACPAGQNATGGSVAVEPAPPGAISEFSVYEMLPFNAVPGGPVDSVWAVVDPEDPVSYAWSERAFALCV